MISSGCFVPNWVRISNPICGERLRKLGLFGWVETEKKWMRTWKQGGDVCRHEKA